MSNCAATASCAADLYRAVLPADDLVLRAARLAAAGTLAPGPGRAHRRREARALAGRHGRRLVECRHPPAGAQPALEPAALPLARALAQVGLSLGADDAVLPLGRRNAWVEGIG